MVFNRKNLQKKLWSDSVRELRHLRVALIALVITAGCWLIPKVSHAQWRSLDTYPKDFLTIGSYNNTTAITTTEFFAYFGGPSGILRYDIINREFIEPLSMNNGLVGTVILRMAVSFDDEKLWAETEFGVFLYERVFGYWVSSSRESMPRATGSYVDFEPIHNPPHGYTYFPDGILMDAVGRQFIIDPPYRDKFGYLWMSIQGFGLARSEIDGGDIEFLTFGILQDQVSSLLAVDQSLYVGGYLGSSLQGGITRGGLVRNGITRLDLRTGAFDYIEQGITYNFPEIDIASLSESQRSIFAGSVYGLHEFSKDSHTLLAYYDKSSGLPNTQVNDAIGYGDTIIVATESGLGILYSDTTGAVSLQRSYLTNFHVFALEPEYFTSKLKKRTVSKTRPRYIWIGAENGAYRLNVKTLKLKKMTDPELILSGYVYEIRVHGSDIWLMADGGLVRIGLQTGESESYLEINYFTDHTSMAINDELVAIGTRSGLVLIPYSDSDGKRKKFIDVRLTETDGLASNDISAVEFAGDYLWIGTNRGLSRFWWNSPTRVY